jgi:hypothetical protein
VWETAFDVTDTTFDCNVNRTNGDPSTQMYLINHFLDKPSVFGLPAPDVDSAASTNAVSGVGSLGLQVETCAAQNGRNPNFLLVDVSPMLCSLVHALTLFSLSVISICILNHLTSYPYSDLYTWQHVHPILPYQHHQTNKPHKLDTSIYSSTNMAEALFSKLRHLLTALPTILLRPLRPPRMAARHSPQAHPLSQLPASTALSPHRVLCGPSVWLSAHQSWELGLCCDELTGIQCCITLSRRYHTPFDIELLLLDMTIRTSLAIFCFPSRDYLHTDGRIIRTLRHSATSRV